MTKPANSCSIADRFREVFKARAKRRLDEPKGLYGDTLLHRACYKNDPERVRLLLEKGADPNVANIIGTTPLHCVCFDGHTGIVRLLLDHGAEVDARDKDGLTPLELALQRPTDDPKREEIVDLFREFCPQAVMEKFCTAGPQL